MNITIIGAGALGNMLATKFSKNNNVTLVVKKENESLIKNFTSASEILPDLCDPSIRLMFAPNSLANFLTLGLALLIVFSSFDIFTKQSE